MDEDLRTVTLDELQAWVGREHDFAGVDEVTRSDIRRKLEVFCCDCPLYYNDEVARAYGYRGLMAPVVIMLLWACRLIRAPGEPVFYGPHLRPKAGGIRTDLPNVYPRGVNTATEWEYFEPLYPGHRLSGNWKLIEIKRRRRPGWAKVCSSPSRPRSTSRPASLSRRIATPAFATRTRPSLTDAREARETGTRGDQRGNEPTMEPAHLAAAIAVLMFPSATWCRLIRCGLSYQAYRDERPA